MVTLFSTPDTLVTGPADLSVGIEDTATGAMINDAEVELVLSQLDAGSNNEFVVRTTHGASARGILQAANVTFPNAGRWRITIDVNHEGREGQCSTDLIIGASHQRAYEIWAAGGAPFMVCLLFVLHERRKRSWERERRIRTRSA